MSLSTSLGLLLCVLTQVALARQLLSDDPITCQATTVATPLCQVCIDTKWTQGACEGVHQPNCVKLTDQTSCEADSRCAYFAEKKTCNDVNAPNCPSAAVNLQGCIDYVTGLWKAGDTTCDALRVHCENCVDGDCTGAGPTPPTPTPPTPTPPSPGKTCKWETATVACKADADCGTWASANCNPGEVNWYCKPNGFCHFGAIVQVFQL
eukprot:TRINITY_DN12387_c0_g1_i4.p1 TRINITY_DN12387_c0_g1~~TRINITY_DN12387_c0_g1_i4.p1  ORF type:complete len:208 (+),score=27.63 TRINITY_DN12387_c0_g1_i4:148-771(+)